MFLLDSTPDGPHIISSPRDLDNLKLLLERLPLGGSLRMTTEHYCGLFSGAEVENAWAASRNIADQFGCSAEFRTDGLVCFVKRS